MKKEILEKDFKKVSIKGKPYVEVKERILALATSEKYSIETEYQYFETRKMWVVKAKLTLLGTGEIYTGLAQEIESNEVNKVNFTSALENAETSAVWRACAFAWIWVIEWIASADEVNKDINRWSNFEQKTETKTDVKCPKCWASMKISWTTGKTYCSALCWKQPEKDLWEIPF